MGEAATIVAASLFFKGEDLCDRVDGSVGRNRVEIVRFDKNITMRPAL